MDELELTDIYCDESCHLERDGHDLMVLGAIAAPHARVRALADTLRDLKEAHGLPRRFEIKWTKVSPAKLDFYLAAVDLFLADPDLSFRAYVAHEKSQLRHQDFHQCHDEWYAKTYYALLRPLVETSGYRFRIYVDIKDTIGGRRVATLHRYLSNKLHDPDNRIIVRIQIVRSDEVELLQLADLLIGAVSHANRGLITSTAKQALIRRVEIGAGVSLLRGTHKTDHKVNLFHWHPQPPTP